MNNAKTPVIKLAALEYANDQHLKAIQQIGRFEGMKEAYGNMAEHLDLEKYCQDCGYEYQQPNSSYGQTREDHEAKCALRAARIATERAFYTGETQPTTKA
jgi:hypothetical protein